MVHDADPVWRCNMPAQYKKLLFIGEVETQSGIPIKTIRYYEELGLLRSSGRTQGGFRQFSPEVLNRLLFIKRVQGLGLSLQEIKEILAIYDQGVPPCSEVKEELQAKLVQIDQQIEQLQTFRTELRKLLSSKQQVRGMVRRGMSKLSVEKLDSTVDYRV